jgi:hypothetical protein
MFQLAKITYMYIGQLNALQKFLLCELKLYKLAGITYIYRPI